MLEREHPSNSLNELVTVLNQGGRRLSKRDVRLLENPDTFLELVQQSWRVRGLWPMHGATVKEGFEQDPIYLASEKVVNKYSYQAKKIVIDTLADEFGFNWMHLNSRFLLSDDSGKNVARMLFKGVPRVLGSYTPQEVGYHFERKMFDNGSKSAIEMYAEGRGQEVELHYKSDRHA